MNEITQKCEEIFRQFSEENDVAAAKRCIRALTRAIGPGFHPDTRFSDYVNVDLGSEPVFESSDASSLDNSFEKVLALLEENAIDPCAVAFPVQRRILREWFAKVIA